MVKAFEEILGMNVVVPDNHQTMGAIGAALLAMENFNFNNVQTKFKGWRVADTNYNSFTTQCNGCSNNCEIITIIEGDIPEDTRKVERERIVARWGGTCGKWDIV